MKKVNHDPEWHAYMLTLEKVIKAIASKYTEDVDLRKDCAQAARIGLLHTFPEKCRSYEKWKAGEITNKQWQNELSKFCRTIIRNHCLRYLTSLKTGPWDCGRQNKQKDGTMRHDPQRYAPLDQLLDNGMDVDTDGNITFSAVYTFEDGE